MTKLSELKRLEKFTLNGNEYSVKELQKGKVVLVVRSGDNHLFALTENTEVERIENIKKVK